MRLSNTKQVISKDVGLSLLLPPRIEAYSLPRKNSYSDFRGSPKSYICVKYRVWAEKWREPGMCKNVHSRLLLVSGIADALSSPQHNIRTNKWKKWFNIWWYGEFVPFAPRKVLAFDNLGVAKTSKTTSLLAWTPLKIRNEWRNLVFLSLNRTFVPQIREPWWWQENIQ